MRSGTSFFNGMVYKKTFLRFWPIWAANLVFWLLVLPLRGLLTLQTQLQSGGDRIRSFAEEVGEFGAVPAMVFAVIFGLLSAMAVCSHLYSARSANFMGALPVRREGLFASHYLSGLTMLLAPNVVTFLLTLLVEAAGGMVEWTPLLFWLAALSGMEFFFYSFAVCLGMFTGHLLALPVFYGIFNALAGSVYLLLLWVMQSFYYGFSSIPGAEAAVTWLTPVLRLGQRLGCYTSYYDSGTGSQASYVVRGLPDVGIYALVGLALAIAALLLYRRRHLETAGDVVAVKAMRPVFKYGVAVCSGLFFGYVTASMIGVEVPGMMVAMVLWAIAGCFVAQMLLEKSFRVFRKWKGAAAVAVVFLVLFLVVGFDLTGFETRVPDPSQVASVQVGGLDSAPYDSAGWMDVEVDDPAIIEKVVALHQAAVDHRELTEERWQSGNVELWGLRLTYAMKDGAQMSRYYLLEGWAGDADTPGTVYWGVNQLLTDRALVWQAYGFDKAEERGTLANASYEDWNSGETVQYFSSQEAAALLEAVKADFADGNIGVRMFGGEYDERHVLNFCWTPQNLGENEMTVEIAVQDTASRTIALLEELGARN